MGGLLLQGLPLAGQGLGALATGSVVGLAFEGAQFGLQRLALGLNLGLGGGGQFLKTGAGGLASRGVGEDRLA